MVVEKPVGRSTGRLAQTLRTRWWPRFLAAGVVLIVVGITLVNDTAAKTWIIIAGAAIVFVMLLKGPLSMSSTDYKRDRPMPPGAPGPGGGTAAP